MNAVIESKPIAIIIGMKIAKNGRVSSAMPKLVPPNAKRTIAIGIIRMSLFLKRRTTRPIPLVIAPVLVITWNEPPTIKMNATTSIASCIPRVGA